MSDSNRKREDETSIVTTLHYVIQTQRMGKISEATGLTAVSIALVALGFIAQATELNLGFYAFAYALLAVLLMIGVMTFLRSVQLGADDGELAIETERIRAWYATRVPDLCELVGPRVAEGSSAEAAVPNKMRGHVLLAAHSMIAAVNAALAGVIVALLAGQQLGLELPGAVAAGSFAFALVFGLQLIFARRLWRRIG